MQIIFRDNLNRMKAKIIYNKKLKPEGVMLYLEHKLNTHWQGINSTFLSLKEIHNLNDYLKKRGNDGSKERSN